MIIIIDGYNLLKQVFYKVKGRLDKQRQNFIKQLSYYKSKKKDSIKEIIAVFDGGHYRHATREIRNGITVIFSGQKASADDWIIKFAKKNSEKEILLVSKDKELIGKCFNYGVDSIGGEEFYNILQSLILNTKNQDVDLPPNTSTIYKYEDYQSIYDFPKVDTLELDLLMEQASLQGYEKAENHNAKNNKQKKYPKTSKREKKILRKIKKL